MATADELLQSMLSSVSEHTHRVVDDDSYFIIDPFTRQIDNRTYLPITLMQHDHNSERFTFEVPRYVDGHDMTLCNRVRVHFNNISITGFEHQDVYECDDLRIDPKNPDNVICTWLISRNATQYDGTLSFLVQYMCVVDEEPVYEWHSDIYSNVVVNSGRNNEAAAVAEYTNILDQWRTQLFGAGDSVVADIKAASDAQQAEIEAKGVETLASIPDEYTTVANNADEALRRKADAIVLSEVGEHIYLDDSSNSYLLGLNIYGKTTQAKTTGKNLFDVATALANQKVASNTATNYSAYGNGVHTYKDAYNSGRTFMYLDVPAGTYTISANIEATETWNFSVKILDASTDLLSENHEATDKAASFLFTIDVDSTVGFCFVPTMSVGIGVYATNIQLEKGSSVTSWEPYSNEVASPSPEQAQELVSIINPTTYIHGKNLFDGTFDDGIYEGTSLNADNNGVYKSLKVFLTPGSYTISFSTPVSIVRFGINRGDTISTTTNITSFTFPMVSAGTVWITFRDATSSSTVWDSSNIVQIVKTDDACNLEGYVSMQSIDLTHTLRGIPVSQNGNYIDENGQQWICDEVDFERGKFIQRVGMVVLDENKDYHFNADNNFFQTTNDCATNSAAWETRILSNRFVQIDNGIGINDYDWLQLDGGSDIRFKMEGIATVDDLTTWIASNNIEVLYPFVTPVETDLTSAEMEAFRALHTNATNTTILNNQNAGMKVKYVADLERYIYKNVTIKQQLLEIILPVSSWVESEDKMYHSQVVNVSVRPNSEIRLHPTVCQQLSLIQDGIVMFLNNDNGVVTAYAVGGIPGSDFTIRATEQVVVYA